MKKERDVEKCEGTYPRNHVGVISAGAASEQLDAKTEWRTFIESTQLALLSSVLSTNVVYDVA